MFHAEQRATQSLEEMHTASQPAVLDIFPAQIEVRCMQQENPHRLVTSGHWAQGLLRENKEFCRRKCHDMLWFLIFLSSSSSQGPFSQPYNLLHQSCVLWLYLFVLLLVSIISAAFLGFSQHLLAILLPKEAGPNPKDLGVAIATGERWRRSWWRKEALCHISAPRRLGLWLHEHFFGSHTSLCNPHLISPFPPLASMWYYSDSHQGWELS